jgi:hypothetical protein
MKRKRERGEKEKEMKLLSKNRVACLAFLCTILIVVGIAVVVIMDIRLFQLYGGKPSLESVAKEYHDTWSILKQTGKASPSNKFYMAFDLTPRITEHSLKILSYAPVEETKDFDVRVLVVCGQHGREYVSSEICYNLIRLLQVNVREETFTPKIAEFMARNVGFYIVPVANPWARILVETNETRHCQRTNKNGVDLNRNFMHKSAFGYMHGSRSKYSDDGISMEDNPGPAPMSEYETVAMAEYISYVNPHLVINIHSGGKDILLPYDCTFDVLPPHYSVMVSLAKHTRNRACPACSVGTGASSLYPAFGTLVDYALDFMGVQLAYTFEVYSSPNIKNDHALTNDECKVFFNPPEGKELHDVVHRWIKVIVVMVNRLLEITI